METGHNLSYHVYLAIRGFHELAKKEKKPTELCLQTYENSALCPRY